MGETKTPMNLAGEKSRRAAFEFAWTCLSDQVIDHSEFHKLVSAAEQGFEALETEIHRQTGSYYPTFVSRALVPTLAMIGLSECRKWVMEKHQIEIK